MTRVGPWECRRGLRIRVIKPPTVAEELDAYYRTRPTLFGSRSKTDQRTEHKVTRP